MCGRHNDTVDKLNLTQRRNCFKHMFPPCHLYASLLVILKMSSAECIRRREISLFFARIKVFGFNKNFRINLCVFSYLFLLH